MTRKRDQAGTFELLTQLPQQIVTLAKVEYENAKREVVSKAKKAGIGAGAIVVALFFVFFMLEALVIAAIAALALVWPWWLAALVVAAGLLLLAAVSILAGVALIRRGNPVPEETLDRVGHDLTAISEVRVNAEPSVPRTPHQRMPQAGEEGNWR